VVCSLWPEQAQERRCLHLGEEAELYGEALQVSVLHALVLQAALPGLRWQALRPHGAE